MRATVDLTREPARFFPVISRITMHPEAEIARSWEHHAFGPGIAPDLLNLLVEEEKWVANRQSRPPRMRQELAAFIDTSILDEATR
jgi:NitT/TauT family transport system substrate-binding protein